jgi:hypothetical protein
MPAAESGITFTNRLDELTGAANRVLYNGAGVAAGDYDGDGRPDLFFCDLSGTNGLYRNLGGFRFEDRTREAGLAAPLPFTRAAAFADLNGDGAVDLLVSVNGRGVAWYPNDGRGRFGDAVPLPVAGAVRRPGPTSLALADVDGNGTLDVYVTHYRPDDIRDRGRVNMQMIGGRPVLPGSETNRFVMLGGRLEECGQADQLYLNDGQGRFQPVPWTEGAFLDENGVPLAEAPVDWGLTATFRDLDGDGDPDLYVCNDYWTPDRCWINDGRGRFRALPRTAIRKTPASSMSVDFADIDRDGFLDLFAVDMLSRFAPLRKRQLFAQMHRPAPVGIVEDRQQVMRNVLLLNRGDGTYAEIAAFSGVAASDWSWSPVFLDVDLDGFEDLLIGAGHFRDVQDYDGEAQVQARQHAWTGFRSDAERQKAFTRELMEHYHLYPRLDLPIGAFRNRRDTTFEEVTAAWGLDVPGIHQGLALADFDGDGALDLAVNRLNGPATVYRHQGPAGRVAVRLVGRTPNTQAIGAQVTLIGGAIPRQSTEVIAGGRYQSGSATTVSFATGAAVDGMTLEVRWRDGTRTVAKGVRPGRILAIDQPAAGNAAPPPSHSGPAPAETPWFEDVSAALGHRHAESSFDEAQRQPLLPYRLDRLGPGVAWADLEGDGDDDLVLGAGRGGPVSAFRNEGGGRFRVRPLAGAESVPDDILGLVVGAVGTPTNTVYAAVTGYEAAPEAAVLAFDGGDPSTAPPRSIARGMPGGGVLALADPAGDGRWMLFVAGGVVPGQYPRGSPSRVFRHDGATWVADDRNSALLAQPGIVNGAVWTDLDQDGVAELVLACEWGPLRVFRVRAGQFREITAELGLAAFTGWWRGVTAVDLDNDGRMDLVASNWGLNSPYRASRERPLVLAFGQIAQPEVTDVVETEYVDGVLAPRRQLAALAGSLPFLLERFSTHRAYSEATLDDVLGERAVLARRVAVTTLESMAFLNTGSTLRPVVLPREAQFAPAFGVTTADLDGDGHEDVFLAQNLSAVQPETTPLDAGLGLWLRGDGRGGLEPLPARRTGIRMLGDQRGAAVADFDGDGRTDLVVTQNGAETRLFRNRHARPGLRVRLQGPPTNPQGIGASMRLEFGERTGPAREIRAGAGYGSQDSAVVVLGTPTPPTALVVRWPGGRVTRAPLPPDAREVTVTAEGRVEAGRVR